MLHIVHMIQHRHPERAGAILAVATALSLSGLAIGVGLLLLRG